MNVEKLDLFNNFNINPVPLEFSQGLTTSEVLAHLQSRVNTLIDAINEYEFETNTYTDNAINGLRILLSKHVSELSKLIDLAQVKANEYTDSEVNVLKGLFDERVNTVNTIIEMINNSINSLNQSVERLSNVKNIVVVNPTTGTLTDLQGALNSIYNNIRVTLKWEEINALGITWQEVEDLRKKWLDIEFHINEVFNVNVNSVALATNL